MFETFAIILNVASATYFFFIESDENSILIYAGIITLLHKFFSIFFRSYLKKFRVENPKFWFRLEFCAEELTRSSFANFSEEITKI